MNDAIMNEFTLGILRYVLGIVASIIFYAVFLSLSIKILRFSNQDVGVTLNVALQYAFSGYILSMFAPFVLGLLIIMFIAPTLGTHVAIILWVLIDFFVYGLLGASIISKGYQENVVKSFLAWLIASIMMSVLITILYVFMPETLGTEIKLRLGYNLIEYKEALLHAWDLCTQVTK